MNLTKQLTLGVSLKDELTFTNFYTGKNAHLINALKKASHGKGEKVIYFYNTDSQGCTHLLQACCHEAHQAGQRAVYIALENNDELSPEIFDGLEDLDLICLDDIHRIAGKPLWEEALFHLYNRIQDTNKHLIVTANVIPKGLGLILPDVESRLVWGMVFQLQPLSDPEKLAVLMMRAERRGMTLNEDVAKFILSHWPRDMAALFTALDTLDKSSLAAQRKLTIPFVKAALKC